MNEELRSALVAARSGDEERARVILAEFLRSDPNNVPAWVLLSKLAASNVQKAAFLRKVLDLDPQHAYARQALQELDQAPAPIISGVGESPAGSREETPEAIAPESEPFPSFDAIEEERPEVSYEQTDFDEADFDEADFDEADFDEFDFDEGWGEENQVEEPGVTESVSEDASDFSWPASHEPDDFDAQATGDTIPPWVTVDETMIDSRAPAPPAVDEDLVDEEEEELPDWLREESDADWLDEETGPGYKDTESTASLSEEAAASEKAARLSAAMATPQAARTATPDADESRSWLLPLLLLVAAVIFLVLVYFVLTYFM